MQVRLQKGGHFDGSVPGGKVGDGHDMQRASAQCIGAYDQLAAQAAAGLFDERLAGEKVDLSRQLKITQGINAALIRQVEVQRLVQRDIVIEQAGCAASIRQQAELCCAEQMHRDGLLERIDQMRGNLCRSSSAPLGRRHRQHHAGRGLM